MKPYLAICLFLGLLIAVTGASAQESLPRTIGFKQFLLNKELEEPTPYDTPPLQWGTFLLKPSLRLEESYNDNILATKTNARSDFITHIEPTLVIEKSFGRHSLTFAAQGAADRHADYSRENTADFFTSLSGLFEVTQRLKVSLLGSYEKTHVDRADQRRDLNTTTDKPREYSDKKIEAGFVLQPNRLRLHVIGRYGQRRNEDATLLQTGLPEIQKDKDFDYTQLESKLSYETRTGWTPYILTLLTRNDYVRRMHTGAGFTGDDRSNDDIRALAGVEYNARKFFYGNLGFGWEKRKFEEEGISDGGGLAMQGLLGWRPDERFTLELKASQENRDDSQLQQGIDTMEAGLEATYQLQSDIFLKASGGFIQEDFTNIDRSDKTRYGGVGVDYFLTPKIRLGPSYAYEQRKSNAADGQYNQNIFMVYLRGAL